MMETIIYLKELQGTRKIYERRNHLEIGKVPFQQHAQHLKL